MNSTKDPESVACDRCLCQACANEDCVAPCPEQRVIHVMVPSPTPCHICKLQKVWGWYPDVMYRAGYDYACGYRD